KNVMTAWSSFCIDVGQIDNSGVNQYVTFKDETKRKQIRQKNIEDLQGANAQTQNYYIKCVTSLPFMCHKEKGKLTTQNAQVNSAYENYGTGAPITTTVSSLKGTGIFSETIESTDFDYTVSR